MEATCCATPQVVATDDGMQVCESCAAELGPSIDAGAEWRHYADDGGKADPSRCGASADGFASTDGSMFRVAYRRNADPMSMALMQSLRSHSNLPGEKSMLRAFARIENVLSIYGQPRGVILLAQQMYRSLSEEYTTRGDNREGQIAYAVALAYEQINFKKSLKEIADMFMVDLSQVIKSAKKADVVAHKLGMQRKELTPLDLVAKICQDLGLDNLQMKVCMYVAHKWDKLGLEIQNTPRTTAGALVYMSLNALGTKHTRDEIAAAAQMCNVSLDKCFKKVTAYKDKLLAGVPGTGQGSSGTVAATR